LRASWIPACAGMTAFCKVSYSFEAGPMLLIPTYVAKSPIHGFGLFAAAPVKAGTVLWRLEREADWCLSPEELAAVPPRLQERIRFHAYLDRRGFYVYSADGTKFMNHADAPNCVDLNDDEAVAARDIAAGEELTCNYRSFDLESQGTVEGLFDPHLP
jgi:uncharacterized protein